MRDDASQEMTVYVSTVVGDRPTDVFYEDILDDPLTFAPGEDSQTMTINFIENRENTEDLTFSLIVQAVPDPDFTNFLASAPFTVPPEKLTSQTFHSPSVVLEELLGRIGLLPVREWRLQMDHPLPRPARWKSGIELSASRHRVIRHPDLDQRRGFPEIL